MFSVSNLLAILASFIILFFGGYIYYGILAAGFYESHAGSATGVQKEQVDMTFIAIACLVEAFVMTSIYSKWTNGDYTVSSGFKFGAFVGLFVGFGIGFITYATTNLSDITGHIVDGIWNIFFYGLTGVVIALVLNKTSKKET